MSGVSKAQALFQRTFPPLIGCLTSPNVETICQQNNLSFAELLRPFCNVYVDNKLKDPSGNDLPIKHLKIGVQDIKDQPPAPAVARLLLNEAVAGAWCEVTQQIESAGFILDIPIECPWYQAWTETFLQVQFPSEHEFLRHLLGCILVTSTQDPPETLQLLLENLKQLQVPVQSRLPKWFCPAIFKFYVVVHDVTSGDKTAAVAFFESIKTAYGSDHCYFLELNSRQSGEDLVRNLWSDIKPKTADSVSESIDTSQQNAANSVQAAAADHPLSPLTDAHNSIHQVNNMNHGGPEVSAVPLECGICLSTKDLDSLRELMVLVVRNALLPHVEKQIYILNDLVANKKGVSRSLLSATKRFFGSSRPGSSPTTPAPFTPDAAELQLRRLGDLYFLFSSYANAFQAYYTAKRDLGLEQAWLHYAGALEMAALSSFMSSEQTKKAVEYIEEAIVTYQNSCQLPQFATRATILGIECLKERQMYAEAAKQLIRMTSEDSDLRSALLLEQAAYCVLRDSKPRKYAFHMVLAGHRYAKAGQRKHALRCVRQALQVYDGRGWSLAEDHIFSTMGRLAGQLHVAGGSQADPRLLGEGLHALSQLLHSRSRQAAGLQAAYLLDYLNMHQAWVRDNPQARPPVLPLPTAEDNSACVRVGSGEAAEQRMFPTDTAEAVLRCARMEELALTETIGAPMVFKPTVIVFSRTTINAHGPVMAVNERLEVQVGVRNPLQISLPMSNIHLLWTWTGEDGRTVQNDPLIATTEYLPSLLLPPLAVNFITISVQPHVTGQLQVQGISFALTTAVAPHTADQVSPVITGRQDIIVRGPKLRPPRDKPLADHFADDRRLHATVIPAAPMLSVSGLMGHVDMICGQIEEVPLQLCNTGNMAVTSLHVVVDAVGLVNFTDRFVSSSKIVVDNETSAHYQVVTLNLSEMGGSLAPGAKLHIPVWLRAPAAKGPATLHIMFLYTGSSHQVKHRIARTHLKLNVSDGLQVTAIASRSQRYGSDALTVCLSSVNEHVTTAKVCSLVMAASHWVLKDPALCPPDVAVAPGESLHLVASVQYSDRDECSLSGISLNEAPLQLHETVPNLLMQRAVTQLMALGLLWEISTSNTIRGLTVVEVDNLGSLSSSAPAAAVASIADASYSPRTLIIFGPDRVPAAQRDDERNVSHVVISISHPDVVEHCFASNRLCLVDVTITIRNTSSKNICVDINPTSGDAAKSSLTSHVYNPHASSAFTWAGRARTRADVPARGHIDVGLRAALSTAGTYDVGVRLSASLVTSRGLLPLPQVLESPLVVLGR